MEKLVLPHQTEVSDAESIILQVLNLPPWLPTLISTMLMLQINLRLLPKSLVFNVERICTKRLKYLAKKKEKNVKRQLPFKPLLNLK